MNSYLELLHFSKDRYGWSCVNKNDLKRIVAGLLISNSLSILVFPTIHMLVQKFTSPDTTFAVIDLIPALHPAVFISGLYIGFHRAGNKYLNSFTAGVLNYPIYLLIISAILNHQHQFSIGTVISIMKDGLVCLLGACLAAATMRWRDISVL